MGTWWEKQFIAIVYWESLSSSYCELGLLGLFRKKKKKENKEEEEVCWPVV